MKPITYKQVIDHKGTLQGIELWQGDQHITISLELKGLHTTGYIWGEVKSMIDSMADELKAKMQRDIRIK
jgi:hypothetical protein